jgi:hypothetical protein
MDPTSAEPVPAPSPAAPDPTSTAPESENRLRHWGPKLRGIALLVFLAGVFLAWLSGRNLIAPIQDPASAAAVVMAADPRFAHLGVEDPALAGQGSWWHAAKLQDGYAITVQIGWDDCASTCLHAHHWVFVVWPDGTAEHLFEDGEPLPSAAP